MSQERIPAWVSVGILSAVNILLAFLVSAILFYYLDINPIDAAKIMWSGAFETGEGIGYTLYYATGFIFTGLAVAVAFHAGLFNIGGEGQAYIGGLGVGLVCLLLGDVLPFALLLPLSIIAGGLFGAAWAFIPAWLQAKRGSHIVITTIMSNFIAASLMAYLLVEVLKPSSQMSAESKVFPEASWLPKMNEFFGGFGLDIPTSPLNISFFWALICAALVWVFIWHTRWGYEIRSVGASQSASAYAGISYPKVVILAMVISGMLSGFFALNALQGELHQIKLNFVEGFGVTGIAVALMGRNHPVGVILASLLFGFLYQGGAELSFEYGVDRNIVVVLQGLVILFCGALEHMMRPRIEQLYLAFANRATAQAKGA
ncbi:ABC transporter permease [Aeromonas finlandensis]|uniref:ABC transporter permease n=1 Tax=Aeromonas finlandensis TaxID=1543375 RepID=UPI00051C2A5C|nr:ABC transporter permease [Aeromonas finlandensis]